jgi:hypothetical protein
MNELLEKADPSYIFNADETCWRLYPQGILTWAEKGKDNVQLHCSGDEKASITVMAAISAAGDKLPLFFIAKGKTVRAERSQIGDVGLHDVTHSETGWMTVVTFKEYLTLLREHHPDIPVIHLLLDVYAAHRSKESKDLADQLGIKLYFVPAGCTDMFQPLDRLVFGALKATARKMFHDALARDPQLQVTKPWAVQLLVESWKRFARSTVELAWDCYILDDILDEMGSRHYDG